MGGIGKNRHNDIQVKRKIIALYTLSIKLKETYNECQYYMSFEDLKAFYETSFFTKSKFCNQLHDLIKTNNALDLFLPKIKSTYYISYITLCLIFKSKEIEYLLNNAVVLEEKSFEILNELAALEHRNGNVVIEEFISRHSQQQQERISSLKKMIKTYY